jgi:hypothetical protein
MATTAAKEARFVRCDDRLLGSKVCSRVDVLERLAPELRDRALAESERGMSEGAFLGRLWGKFGPPEQCDDGFLYPVRDTATGETFNAYSGPSGPSYGAQPGRREELKPVLVAFETWICQGPPAECSFEYVSDEFGTQRVGIREGKPFEETVAPPKIRPQLERARSVRECFEMLEQWDANEPLHGFRVAFEDTLEPTVQKLVDDFEMFGIDYDARCITADDIHGHGIPLDDLKLPPLKGAAAHWMRAYRKWRSELP